MKLPSGLNLEQLQLIGEGKQGKVYQVDSKRCIKIFKKRRYFNRELKALKQGQKSPYFPRLYQVGDEYIIREYFKGPSLEEYLTHHNLSAPLAMQLIKIIRNFEELGFKRLDIRLPHIIVTGKNQLRIIDPTNMVKYKTNYPEKLLAGLETLGQKTRFLRWVAELDPELYQLWEKRMK